jgi:hypothetical protein
MAIYIFIHNSKTDNSFSKSTNICDSYFYNNHFSSSENVCNSWLKICAIRDKKSIFVLCQLIERFYQKNTRTNTKN